MHTIRLHGPWEYEPLARFDAQARGDVTLSDNLPPSGRITAPCDWGETLGADFHGRVRYRRHFHRPTGLEEDQPVFLVIERVDALGTAFLNERRLGELTLSGGPFRFEVGRDLLLRNMLTIEVELPHPADPRAVARPGREQLPGGLIGEVRLEIEEPD